MADLLDHVRQCDACEEQWQAQEVKRIRERTLMPKPKPETMELTTTISQMLKALPRDRSKTKETAKVGGKSNNAPSTVRVDARTILIVAAAICVAIGAATLWAFYQR